MNCRLLLLVACGVLGGCSKCGKEGGQPTGDVTRYLPKNAEAVLVVPELGALGKKLSLLENLKVASFAAQLNGMNDAHAFASALMAQAGVDLRSSEAIAGVGIDPARPLAVALLEGGRAYAVVAVKDEKKLHDFLESLSRNRLGAGNAQLAEKNGVKLTWFQHSSGKGNRLGYALKDGWAFVGADEAIEQLSAWAAVPAEQSLKEEQALQAALGRLPKQRDLYAHVPSQSPFGKQAKVASLTVTVHLSPEALDIRADLPWRDEKSLEMLAAQAGPDLFRYLPDDAFLVARFSGDPDRLAPYWAKLLGPHLERAFNESGFDPKAEIFANMKPGATFALSLAPDVKLSGGMPELDVRRTNPFRYVHLSAIAEAKDATKLSGTLDKVPPIAPRFAAQIEPGQRNGQKVFLTRYAQGEGIHFAAVGEKAVFGAPIGRLDEMLARVKSTGQKPGPLNDPELRKPFEKAAAVAVVDLRKLAESVKALPSEAWGVGGFAIKATTVRWLDATDDLKAVTLSFDARKSAMQAELSLKLQMKAAGK